MKNIMIFLFSFIGVRKLSAPTLYIFSVLGALSEIYIFFISAAALQFFLTGDAKGIGQIIEFLNMISIAHVDIYFILISGVVITFVSILLNLSILKQIKHKVVTLGNTLQSKIINLYLKNHIDFRAERNSKIDLKVLSESVVVIVESVLLQLYLALNRLLVCIIYAISGFIFIGPSFIYSILLLSLIFTLSVFIFTIRTNTLINSINVIGERYLRILTNFVHGRVDINLFGLPKGLSIKLNNELYDLLKCKIKMMTEVQKPRILIEGIVIFVFIGLGIIRMHHQALELTSTHLTGIIIVLRLLPAVHQFTSYLRAAVSASWAINDVNILLNSNNEPLSSEKATNHWKCDIKIDYESSEFISIQADSITLENPKQIVFKSGVVNIVKGASGIGKSTLLHAVIEALQEHEEWDDKLRHITSYMPQNPVTYLTSFHENIWMGSGIENVQSSASNEKMNFTSNWVRQFNSNVDSNNLIVSGGEAQRLSFLRCISNEKRSIILLDEPTSAVDINLSKKVGEEIEELARQGKFIIMITHNDMKINDRYSREIQL